MPPPKTTARLVLSTKADKPAALSIIQRISALHITKPNILIPPPMCDLCTTLVFLFFNGSLKINKATTITTTTYP